MSTKSLLIDITKCIGCRGCQVACKQWNDLPGEETSNTGSFQNPPLLSAKTWTLIRFDEFEQEDHVSWYFTRIGCMHCEKPACASVCPVGALRKTKIGAVVYDAHKCIGCRYCMIACPFRIPTFEWDKALPYIKKCTFCHDRQVEGEVPACAKTCPTGAITYGDRDEVLAEAQERIHNNPDKYNPHIYGKDEVGGTDVIYLIYKDVDFTLLGFPRLGTRPLPELTRDALRLVPGQIVIVGALMGAFYWLTKRRLKNKAENKEAKNDE